MSFKSLLSKLEELPLWLIFLLALVIRLAFFCYFYFIYLTPGGGRLNPASSDPTYHYAALQILQGSIATGYLAYHTPLMGMLIAFVYAVFGVGQVYVVGLVQIIISAMTCLVPYTVAQSFGKDIRFGKLASLGMALDLSSIGVSMWIGAEVLSNFFIAISMLFLARLLQKGQIRDALACAAAVILAALARPNAIYFVVVLAVIIIILSPRRWINTAVLVVVCVCGLTPWFVRNYIYQHVFTFSTVGNFNLLFYRAVSVEYWATGKPVGEIQAQLAYELDKRLGLVKVNEVYDASSIWRHLALDDGPRADNVMREMAIEIFMAHPKDFAISLSVALLKVISYSETYLPVPFFKWLNLLWNMVLYIFVFNGWIFMLLKKQWQWLAFTTLPIVYFVAVPTLAGGVQDTRSLTSVTICLVLIAAYGAYEFWQRRYPKIIA